MQRAITKAKPTALSDTAIKPMLATAGEAFSRKDWLFEIKYDGYRLLCIKENNETRLMSRNGNDLSQTFPEIPQAVSRLPFNSFIIDGEAVVHDTSGMPNFARMQRRGRLSKPSAIERAMHQYPATLYSFDLIAFADYDLRKLPLVKRKDFLRMMIPVAGMIKYSDHIERDGQAMYQAAERLGLEGIVGKSAKGKYVSGRSDQ